MKKILYILISVISFLLLIPCTMLSFYQMSTIEENKINLSDEMSATVKEIVDFGANNTEIRIYTYEYLGFICTHNTLSTSKSKEDFLKLKNGDVIYFRTQDNMDTNFFCIAYTLRTDNEEFISLNDHMLYIQNLKKQTYITSIGAPLFFIVLIIISVRKLIKLRKLKKRQFNYRKTV